MRRSRIASQNTNTTQRIHTLRYQLHASATHTPTNSAKMTYLQTRSNLTYKHQIRQTTRNPMAALKPRTTVTVTTTTTLPNPTTARINHNPLADTRSRSLTLRLAQNIIRHKQPHSEP